MSGAQTPAIPEGYVGLADAPRHVAAIRPADRQRARVLIERAIRGGAVEVVELVDGDVVLVGAGELASAALDFSSGRIRRAGIAPGKSGGPIELVRVFLGNQDPTAPGFERRATTGIAAAAAGTPAIPAPDKFSNVVTYTSGGEVFIDWEKTRRRQREAESGRAPAEPAPESAGLSEEFYREILEEAAGTPRYAPAPARPSAPAMLGPDWGPLIYLWIEDLDRALAPNASRRQPESPPAVEIGEGADEGAKRGRPLAFDVASIKMWMRQTVIRDGLPPSKQILSNVAHAYLCATLSDPPAMVTVRRWVAEIWEELSELLKPPKTPPSSNE